MKTLKLFVSIFFVSLIGFVLIFSSQNLMAQYNQKKCIIIIKKGRKNIKNIDGAMKRIKISCTKKRSKSERCNEALSKYFKLIEKIKGENSIPDKIGKNCQIDSGA
ncbi:hypothetical protein ACFL20_05410 [Spirochaetota bacterium]